MPNVGGKKYYSQLSLMSNRVNMKKYRRGSKIVEIVNRKLRRRNKPGENTGQVPVKSLKTTQNSPSAIDQSLHQAHQSTYQRDTTDQEQLLETAQRDMCNITKFQSSASFAPSTSTHTTDSGDDVQADTMSNTLRPADLLTLLNDDLYLTDSSDDYMYESDSSSDFIGKLLRSAHNHLKGKPDRNNSNLYFEERVISESEAFRANHTEADTVSGSVTTAQRTHKKRKAVPSQWKKNLRKNKRLRGEPYLSAKGNLIPGKTLKESKCMGRCMHLCTTKFNEEERMDIFSSFWNISNVEKKRLYIVSLIQREKTKTTNREQSRKKLTNKYFLKKIGATEKIRVCQKFFIATLSVTETFIRFCFKKVIDTNIVVEDKRGKHAPHNKKPKEVREHVRNHIKSFPRLPAPRVRGDLKKEYLGRNLNLTKMYKLYKIKCDSELRESVELAYYRSVFKKDFNIGFHRPGRDICDTCSTFEQMNRKEKQKNKKRHEEHLRRISNARQHRGEAKSLAHLGEIHFAEYDLKTICECPSTASKPRRTLPVNNFTILDFNREKRNVLCFCWHEGIARKGATEIGSCLYKYLQSNADGKPITFMSDTCASQCRNMYISSLLLYCTETLNIPEINQKYFEQGHSQMETDSIHDGIEKAKKNAMIVHQSDFYNIIRKSLRKYPNNVYEMNTGDFIDLKYLKNALIKNAKVDHYGEPVNWLNIRWLQYRKESPNHIYFKYDLDDTEFNVIKVIRRGKRPQQSEEIVLLKKIYHGPLSTTVGKYGVLNN